MQSALFGPSFIDLSIFLTMGFVISSFRFPIVLERAGIVSISIGLRMFLIGEKIMRTTNDGHRRANYLPSQISTNLL